MAYDTLNPLGSKDPRDLYDNATNFDLYSNGPNPFYPNRFGVQKLSIEGMNQAFNDAQSGRAAQFETAIAAVGYVWVGDYGAGITFTSRSQYTVRDGVPYILANDTTLPYTTTGNWATEISKFKVISLDDILRQDLASSDAGKGVNLVYGAVRTLDSAAAVEASAGRFAGDTVLLKGWHADLPGIGSNRIYWDPLSTLTPDRGSVYQATGQATGRWITIFPEGPISAASWGLRPDLTTDQIARIEAAVAYCAAKKRGWVRLLEADIYISLDSHGDGSGLVMPTGVYLDLTNTTLRALPTASAGYSVVLFKETCLAGGVFGRNGKIIGERDGHLGTGGEFGMGVNVRGASNIYIADITVSKCWGDGVYLGADTTGNQATFSSNVVMHNITCDQNRRNGTSITNAKHVRGTGYYVGSRTSGTSPEAGIDIEPDVGGLVQDVNFEFIHCFDNAGNNFMTFSTASDPVNTPSIVDVHVTSLLSERSGGVGMQWVGVNGGSVTRARCINGLNKGGVVEACVDFDIIDFQGNGNKPTGQFQRGDLTIAGSRSINILKMSSRNAVGPSALIIRGSSDVWVGRHSIASSGLTEAAIQVEVNCDGVTLESVDVQEVGGTSVYIDPTCIGFKLNGSRLKNVGRTNTNSVLIQNGSNGAIIQGVQYTSNAGTKPFSGIVSSGNYCNVNNNTIPGSQLGGTAAQAVAVSGTGSISPNNITAG